MDKKLELIEKLSKQIESEKDIEASIKLFAEATELIKQSLMQSTQVRGKVTELVRELDEFIEKEVKIGGEEC